MDYLKSIQIFVQLFQLGSFSEVGRQLRISPGKVSECVSRLETRLGIRLFNRTTRHVAATGAGMLFYDYAVRISRALDEAEAAVAVGSGNLRGRIRALAPPGIARRYIAPLIPEFHDRHPKTSISLRLSDEPTTFLEEGVDLIFDFKRPEDHRVESRIVADFKMMLAASPRYLALHGRPTVPADLSKSCHRCFPSKGFGQNDESWRLSVGERSEVFPLGSGYGANDGDVILDWALAGQGIMHGPILDLEPYINSGQLCAVLPSTPPTSAIMWASFSQGKEINPELVQFVEFVCGRFSEASGEHR